MNTVGFMNFLSGSDNPGRRGRPTHGGERHMKLELKNITKKYDLDTLGAEDVSLSVEDGVFGIAGEPGSGKRTVLGIVGGLLNADSGELLFDGRDALSLSPRERDAFLSRGKKLPLGGSVERNLTYGLRLRRVSGKEAKCRAEEAAEALGISGLLRRSAASLTPPERMKAELARLLTRRARIALFYDPYRDMTADERAEARSLLLRVRETIGDCAAVIATPNGGDLAYAGGCCAVMRGGRIVRSGAAEDVAVDPRSAYVAKFVSERPVNIVTDGGRAFAVRADDTRLAEGGFPVVGKGGGYTALLVKTGEPPFVVKGEAEGDRAGYTVLFRTELPDEGRTPSEIEENSENLM